MIHRLGTDAALGLALGGVAMGVLVRAVGGIPQLIIGTVIIGAALALCNVVIPP